LTWVKRQDNKKKLAEADEKPGKGNKEANQNAASTNEIPPEEADIFSIVPDVVLLPPKHGIMY